MADAADIERVGSRIGGTAWKQGCKNGMSPSMYSEAAACLADEPYGLVHQVMNMIASVPWLEGELGIRKHARDVTIEDFRVVTEMVRVRESGEAASTARKQERIERNARQVELF